MPMHLLASQLSTHCFDCNAKSQPYTTKSRDRFELAYIFMSVQLFKRFWPSVRRKLLRRLKHEPRLMTHSRQPLGHRSSVATQIDSDTIKLL